MNIESPVDEKKLHKFYENISKSVNQKIEDWLEHYGDLSFSKRIEFERLLNVSNEIRQILGEPSINIAETIKNHVLTEGANGYNSVYYSLETGYNLDLNFHSLDNKFLTELMNSPVAGSTLSKRLYKYRNELASKISDAIARGMSFGYGYDRMALEISTITEANYRQALRIARTEGGRVRSITTQKGYEEVKEKGVDLKKQWMATNDGRTRTDHSLLNGQIQEVDEDFKIGSYKAQGPRMFGVAEEDINCRCTTVTVVNGIAPKLNREGENFYQKKYDDWLKEQGKKNSGKNIPVSLKGLNDDYLNEKREESRLKAGRVNAKKYDAQSESFAKLTNEASMRMRISDIGFRRAVESGNLKSCHEFGDDFAKGRIRIEKTLFNLPENIKRSEMPKYGYLSDSDDLFEKKASHSVLGYGDITIELDDSVRKRTTYTINDSLVNKRGLITSATPVGTKPTYNGIKEKAIGEINSISEFLNSNKKTNRYIEAQYHGDLTFKNDVKRIIVPDNSYLDKFSKEFEQLKNMGIEVLVAPK
ncbi:minor head protein [Lactococcus lactis subsp. lactis Dephy 1]|uniref:phage minor head protein n=1 Tax=Lactococcus lactis TaxID=1358 RepID=UPI0003B8C462|nr:phage minor head protein [Lactococcus lactis]CDI47496.1 minor head protein [Lactococcus lactis subsp. lactis Dephy 1]